MIETIYRCDLCKKQLDFRKAEINLRYKLPHISVDGDIQIYDNQMLCSNCAEKIAEFIEDLKKPTDDQ